MHETMQPTAPTAPIAPTAPTAPTAPEGLSSAEAEARLARWGPNRLVDRSRWQRLRRAAAMLADPMALMLLGAGVVYLALGETRDGVVLLAALVPVLGVDVLLEARSQRALAALAAAVAPLARVVRDGREREVGTEELVPGDVVAVAEGDLLFADARVLSEAHLAVDESPLTGESAPQEKPEGSALYAGSRVLTGQALAEVTATGRRTSYGTLAALVASATAGETPLQARVSRLVRRLAVVAAIVAGLVFALRLGLGSRPADAFLSAISLAMAAIPEEFPLVFTLFLSLGALRLARRGMLVRRLVTVEALGSTTVICTDKTGTLTRGRFELAQHVALGGTDAALLEAAALACEPTPIDPMEQAIATHCEEHGIELSRLHGQWQLAIDHPFESEGRHMTHVWRSGDRWRVVMKGALEGVLAHCAIDGAARAAAEQTMAGLAAAGLRVLAGAARDGEGPLPADRAEAERALELLGLVGFGDPLRPEVPAAVAACRRAGIEIKMITGDHALTARAVAEAAGIAVDGEIVTGPELDGLAPAERSRRVRAAHVLARIRPEQKHDIVSDLVAAGEVVAMTGDGINDAPALRRASIGVSMGRHATEVARSAAGLVLLDDDFGTLVAAVREGRRIYDNLQRAFLFLVGFHIPIVGLAVAAPLLGLPLLLLPIHLVWLELIVHPVAALAFEGEPSPGDAMTRPPRAAGEPLLPRRMLARAVLSGAILTGAALLLYVARLDRGEAVARGVALAVVIPGGVGLVWAERALDRPWWRLSMPRSVRFWSVLAVTLASVPVAMAVPPLAHALRVAPISLADAGLALAAALGAVVWRAGGTR